ncbi:class I SAM-dependent methyltransferase [Pseudothioglobus sp. nBUS_23]|uniref:class I SAM-dependent methyltransferase n=1 Tax=Pseudothioglobus sp. nBUS_23 TaxID=3395318 RepID=UPI003EC0464C
MKNQNKKIFSEYHSGKNLTHDARHPYEKDFIETKVKLLKKYLSCKQGQQILDLCCGTGEYSKYIDTKKNSYYGLDFSQNMLDEFKLSEIYFEGMNLIKADVNKIPITNNKIDICFCFSSLYYFDDIEIVLKQVNRVLLTSGVAILEFGTKNNINAHVSNYWAKNANWGYPYFISYKEMLNAVNKSGFKIVEERNFQLFPVLRGPWWSLLIANSFLRSFLRIKYKDLSIDELISSSRFCQKYAFKHLLVLVKK